MPIFEFICKNCKKVFSDLLWNSADITKVQCPKCRSKDVNKIISRCAVVKSEDERLEKLADLSKFGDLTNPRALRHWVKQMGRELGEDMEDEFEQYIEEAEKEETVETPSEDIAV